MLAYLLDARGELVEAFETGEMSDEMREQTAADLDAVERIQEEILAERHGERLVKA